MKVSISMPEEDLRFLDAYAQAKGIDSRSAVLHKAVRLLRLSELDGAYENAWDEWTKTGEQQVWEPTVRDGLGD